MLAKPKSQIFEEKLKISDPHDFGVLDAYYIALNFQEFRWDDVFRYEKKYTKIPDGIGIGQILDGIRWIQIPDEVKFRRIGARTSSQSVSMLLRLYLLVLLMSSIDCESLRTIQSLLLLNFDNFIFWHLGFDEQKNVIVDDFQSEFRRFFALDCMTLSGWISATTQN